MFTNPRFSTAQLSCISGAGLALLSNVILPKQNLFRTFALGVITSSTIYVVDYLGFFL